jgi:pimeloyl-ACP methyl ester carboxylesterase
MSTIPRTTEELLAELPQPWPREDALLSNGTLSIRVATPVVSDAAPAVFIHGLGGSATNWTDLMALLRDECDSIAVDLPGHGWSPPPRDGDYSPVRSAAAIAELMAGRFDGRPAHVFGNSMGGAVALQLAARHPDLVRTLTLVSPALPKIGVRRTNAHLPVIATPGVGMSLYRRYLALDPAMRAKATVDVCFADPNSVPAERMEQAVAEVRRRDRLPYAGDAFLQSLRGLLATYLDRSPDRPWKLAEGIHVPTLLVYGRGDKLVDPIHAHTKAFPDVRVVVIPDAGHVAQIEHPVLVADAWRSLIAADLT